MQKQFRSQNKPKKIDVHVAMSVNRMQNAKRNILKSQDRVSGSSNEKGNRLYRSEIKSN
jgi:hypothetical protein